MLIYISLVLISGFVCFVKTQVVYPDPDPEFPLPPLPPNVDPNAKVASRIAKEPWLVMPPPNQAPYPLFDPNLVPWSGVDQLAQLPFEMIPEDFAKGLPEGNGIFFNNRRIDENAHTMGKMFSRGRR